MQVESVRVVEGSSLRWGPADRLGSILVRVATLPYGVGSSDCLRTLQERILVDDTHSRVA